MLLSHTQSHSVGMNRSRIMTIQASKGGGFGARKNKSSRRSKPATPEVKKLVGEYSALKQHNSSSSPVAGRTPLTDRTMRQPTEASAATGQQSKPAAADPDTSSSSGSSGGSRSSGGSGVSSGSSGVVAGQPSSTTPTQQTTAANSSSKLNTPPPQSAAAPSTSSSSSSSTAAAAAAAAAAEKKPPTAETPQNSSKDAGTTSSIPAAAAANSATPLPVVPPVPTTFTAAGTRITSFESKLTSRQTPAEPPPAAPAADSPQAAPTTTAAPVGGAAAAAVPAASVAKLSTAHEGLAAAEEHVEGLAQLLREAQSTLASLRTNPTAAEGGAADPAAAAVSAAADSLVSMMSDVMSDITAEMGLVREQLVAACGDIDETKQQLEAAIKAAAPVVPPGKTSAKETFKEDIDVMAAREAAAVAAAAAAVKRESEIKQMLELRDAELAIAQQRTTQLQTQLELLMTNGDDAAAAAGGGSSGVVDPRVHQLLVAQVSSNMAMLDWLGALAKTVVGLEGVSPKDRVKLATTISRCVLAVGGSAAGSSSSSNGTGEAAVQPAAAEQDQQQSQDEF